MKKVFKIINFAGAGLLGAIALTVNILALGPYRDTLQTFVFGYEVDAAAAQQNRETGEKLAKEIVEEGVVLVKNQDNVLPLTNKRVNVFGWSSVSWIAGGSGSGRVVDGQNGNSLNTRVGLIDALHDYGVETSDWLTDFYKSKGTTRPGFSSGTLNTYDYQFHRLIEPSLADYDSYDDSMLSDAKSFSDTAIVVLSRVSGESSDAPQVQYKGSGSSSTPNDSERSYLEASTEEIELLTYVGSNFKNVVVVVNSTNTMNLNFLNTIPGLKGCLVCGATGMTAASGVVSVLYGDANPSGRLSDIYPFDFKTNASYVNSGSTGVNGYLNSDGLYPADGTTNGNVGNNSQKYDEVSYLDYVEGIYVGYKWYETADVEGYWNDIDNEYGKGYDGVVQYPFGYGLSYTNFSWEIVELGIANNQELNKTDEISVKVRVSNIGEKAGQDVVELYYTPPYTNNGIEKSAMNLVAFDKTTILKPGEYEDLTLKFNVREMSSYDDLDKNHDGLEGYVLEKGDYQIKLMKDSHHPHDVVNNGSAVHTSNIINYNVNKNIIYDKDAYSGNDIYNRFIGDYTEDGVSIDGSDSSADIEFLSRSNFKATFPKVKEDKRTMASNIRDNNLYTASMAEASNNNEDEAPTFGANNGLKVYENKQVTELGYRLGANYDDPEWEDVLDQLTENELRNMTLHGYVQTAALSSVGKEKHTNVDGPNQIGSFNLPNAGTGFPCATVVAQTWSTRLAYDFGLALGAEAKTLGYDGWYGPGINIHRSPFGGRNYEYFSEDPILSGYMSAAEVKGAKNQGVYCFLKHFIVYEQESMRDGISVWLTEQTLRELYLKPFEIAIHQGGANGVMTSYGRLGATWAGGNIALINGVLREEWGFHGMVLTDYADHQKFMNGDQQLRAGGDLWMDGYNNNGSYRFDTSSNTFKQHLRRAGHDVLYGWLNAELAKKNYDPSKDSISVVVGEKGAAKTGWIVGLVIGDVVVGAGIIAWVVLIALKKEKPIPVSE